ncbi:MAG: GH36-type glycosyl hydrolase domain-containing protein [Candidatus Eisenbacteria bacterium]
MSDTDPDLLFDNGYGGFARDGASYEIRLDFRAGDPADARRPPQPWCNVVANERFGFLVSESGAGFTWSGNSRLRRLTPWSNDPVLDPFGEALYIRDEESEAYWSPLPGPAPARCRYRVRHGFGWSSFHQEAHDSIAIETTMFVPPNDPVKIVRVTIENRGDRARTLSLFSYARLILGGDTFETAGLVQTDLDIDGGKPFLWARGPANRWIDDDPGGPVVFAACVADRSAQRRFSCDRLAFLGRSGTPEAPAVLANGHHLDGAVSISRGSPCFAMEATVEIAAGASSTVSFLLGEEPSMEKARERVLFFHLLGTIPTALDEARSFWTGLVSGLRIETPEPALDLMVNGWLAYQTLSCRLWGRSAFYQSGGAFGYRDQLQDAAALLALDLARTRAQILLHAAHQFEEGDVLHWWHPPGGWGIRTRFADDLLWLPYVTATYVAWTGDLGILEERVRYLTAPSLPPGEAESYLLPADSGKSGTLYEHCARAIDLALARRSERGLPLFGTGDWNDGMNRVGSEGKGESVWMAFFLYAVLSDFLPLCERLEEDIERAGRYRVERERLREAAEDHAWDGEWYRRGSYDDGTWLGSRESDECRIDALVQAWATISRAAEPGRAEEALHAVEEHLVDREARIVKLLAPPFDRTPHDPGYIKGYLPGVRENGGQYTHAALWVVRAAAELGWNERAMELLAMLLPALHADTPEKVAVYQVEPYVVAADVYGEPPHKGRGGWTWYTGSAGWMLRVALESILGFRVEGGREAVIRPCVPRAWERFSIDWRAPDGVTRLAILCENRAPGSGGTEARATGPGRGCKVIAAEMDGQAVPVSDGAARVPIPAGGGTHEVRIVFEPIAAGGPE